MGVAEGVVDLGVRNERKFNCVCGRGVVDLGVAGVWLIWEW